MLQIVITEFLPVFYILVFISFLIMLLRYLGGKILKREEDVVYLKIELSELLKSLLILILLASFYQVTTSFVMFYYDSIEGFIPQEIRQLTQNKDLIEITKLYLLLTLNKLQDIVVFLSEILHQMELFSEAIARVGAGGALAIETPLFIGADIFKDAVRLVLTASIIGLISVNAQLIAISIIKEISIYFLFPAGFILRLFPQTRSVGNELISLGIVAMVLIPFLYTWFYTYSIEIFKLHENHPNEEWENPLLENEEEGFKAIINKGIKALEKVALITTSLYLLIPINFIKLLEPLTILLFFAVALPTFVVTIAGSLTRGIAEFLESDIRISFMS